MEHSLTYQPGHFTKTDALALIQKAFDITELDLDGTTPGTKITYRNARLCAIQVYGPPALVIAHTGAVITDAATGRELGTLLPEPEQTVCLAAVCEVCFREAEAGS
jgi:hypothetical protein